MQRSSMPPGVAPGLTTIYSTGQSNTHSSSKYKSKKEEYLHKLKRLQFEQTKREKQK